jgi:hypothetical protein
MTANTDGSETTRLLTAPERLSDNLIRQIYGGKIHIFALTSLADAQVDAWIKALDDWFGLVEVHGRPAERLAVVMSDFSKLDAIGTPYSRNKVKELATNHRDLRGFSAVVITKALYAQVPELQREWLESKVQWRYFVSRDTALEWLLIMNGKHTQ